FEAQLLRSRYISICVSIFDQSLIDAVDRLTGALNAFVDILGEYNKLAVDDIDGRKKNLEELKSHHDELITSYIIVIDQASTAKLENIR
ncbi:hypothetical protein ACFLW5_02420, partial [Chloroflexota bacterium]